MEIKITPECSKKVTLDTIQCYEDALHYEEYSELFDQLWEKHQAILQPKGWWVERSIFEPKEILKVEDNSELADTMRQIDSRYEKLFCCLVTLGSEIVAAMDEYFAEGDYMGGVLLNAMADVILFQGSQQLYASIAAQAQDQGLTLSPRQEPGNSSSVMAGQWILDAVKSQAQVAVELTSGYMLNPKKSLAYYYGAGKTLPFTLIDHDCSSCSAENCPHRKAYLTVQQKGKDDLFVRVPVGSNLLSALQEHQVYVQADCAGNHSCGKCKVRQIYPPAIEYTDKEKKLLSQEEQEQGIILACFHQVDVDMTVVPVLPSSKSTEILSDFDFPPIVTPKYQWVEGQPIHKAPHSNDSAIQLINQSLLADYQYKRKAVRQLAGLDLESPFWLLVKDNKVVVAAAQSQEPYYGIAIDIGTTTVAAVLCSLPEGEVLGVEKALNPQKAYGADVISRIQYVNDHPNHSLQDLIKKTLLSLSQKLLGQVKGKGNALAEITIAGNTTMQYLLLDIPPKSLAISPFLTTSLEAFSLSFSELFGIGAQEYFGAGEQPDCPVVILPGLSAYIGADIVAGIFGTDIPTLPGNTLFIDIGTNGELALKAKDRMVFVATAAGPAFEGANISCGMGSLKGAVSRGKWGENTFDLTVIGGGRPEGICGSGLIDLAAVALEQELIEDTGLITDEEELIVFADDQGQLTLTQKDIRELQLAKAAIAAGIEVLLLECDCKVEALDRVFLAGGFGHYLDINHAIRLGLLPKGIKDKTQVVGNSSLSGAVRCLLEAEPEATLAKIKERCEYVELSTDPRFNDLYIEKMMFEEEA